MSLKCDISTFVFIQLEQSIQRGFNDTHFVQHDKTRKNGSNSRLWFWKSVASYSNLINSAPKVDTLENVTTTRKLGVSPR